MEELLIVNPRRRRGGRKSRARARRRGRSAAQRAATRRMIAANRARRGGGISFAANPRRRRRRGKSVARRYRRNPAALLGGFGRINSQQPMRIIQNAAIGAVGAIVLNTVLSRLPLPMMLVTGRTRYLTQGVVALGLGMLAANFKIVGGQMAAQAAEGALTVTIADAIKDFAAAAGFPLAGMGYYLPGIDVRGAVPDRGASPAMHMGKYLTGPGSGNVTPIRRLGAMQSFKF